MCRPWHGRWVGQEPPLAPHSTNLTLWLDHRYTLHHMRLHPSVTFTASPPAKVRFLVEGSFDHRLFISAFMLASKVICHVTSSCRASWVKECLRCRRLTRWSEKYHGLVLGVVTQRSVLSVRPSTLHGFQNCVTQFCRPTSPT
jgi:hypothetical protein